MSFSVRSRCECQATLMADLDDKHYVLAGSARRGATTERAPAHSIGASGQRFDLGWACPFCGRNVLRTFEASSRAPGPLAAR
jgi:hypothetical protein